MNKLLYKKSDVYQVCEDPFSSDKTAAEYVLIGQLNTWNLNN